MRRRRKQDNQHENLERWLLTYADLITLLLAFFIVMYSMSRVDAKRFGKMAEALNGVLKGGTTVLDKPASSAQKGHGLLQIGDLNMIQKQIEQRFSKLGREDVVQTEITERGLVVHIMESALFKVGSATLEPKAKDVLDIVYDQMKGIPNHVRVEGHTDDRPINTALFPSNWELSTARATEVVRYFIDKFNFPPDKLSALGYGEFRPIRPNNSIENRAKNRRVDIVILTMDLSEKEPGSEFYYAGKGDSTKAPQPTPQTNRGQAFSASE
ncbi:MAG TPA: flagellar motor protein MotB [candidate division Zixibacteria bacterium]|nr:flagellar motor protein MotB [candidate division Zixibacteria bacterium]